MTIRKSTMTKAIEEMHGGAQLARKHTRWGVKFYLLPSGREVSAELAVAIMTHSDVVSGHDGLFFDTPQTWRVRS